MFRNQSIKTIKATRARLKAEFEDPELPGHRKEEVESLLYYADIWIREKSKRK